MYWPVIIDNEEQYEDEKILDIRRYENSIWINGRVICFKVKVNLESLINVSTIWMIVSLNLSTLTFLSGLYCIVNWCVTSY